MGKGNRKFCNELNKPQFFLSFYFIISVPAWAGKCDKLKLDDVLRFKFFLPHTAEQTALVQTTVLTGIHHTTIPLLLLLTRTRFSGKDTNTPCCTKLALVGASNIIARATVGQDKTPILVSVYTAVGRKHVVLRLIAAAWCRPCGVAQCTLPHTATEPSIDHGNRHGTPNPSRMLASSAA